MNMLFQGTGLEPKIDFSKYSGKPSSLPDFYQSIANQVQSRLEVLYPSSKEGCNEKESLDDTPSENEDTLSEDEGMDRWDYFKDSNHWDGKHLTTQDEVLFRTDKSWLLDSEHNPNPISTVAESNSLSLEESCFSEKRHRNTSKEVLEEEFYHIANSVEVIINHRLQSLSLYNRESSVVTDSEEVIKDNSKENYEIIEEQQLEDTESEAMIISHEDCFRPSVDSQFTSFLPTTVPILNVTTIIDDYQLDQLLEYVRKS